MWKRSQLKERAKAGVKRNYWKTVLVCLIAGIIAGIFGFASGTGYGFTAAPKAQPIATEAAAQIPAAFWAVLGVIVSLALAFGIFAIIGLVNPFNVGAYKFSLNAVRGEGNVSDLGSGFDTSYKRNVKVMFLYDLYSFLWTMLFIIPGIIKMFEYRMIPYILADNPDMDTKEVFALSKAMMKGNKWRAFVLDLSFILWDCLSGLTLGFVGVLWVSPYKLLTNAALYDELKKNN